MICIHPHTRTSMYVCVCRRAGYCSELRSIATITATMLPVSPFAACRGVRVSMNNGPPTHILRGKNTPTSYSHTHTHIWSHWVCVFNGKHNAWQKGGQSSSPVTSANCMRWECATAVSNHAPSTYCARTSTSPSIPKNCLLQMTNFTFFHSLCEWVCECARMGVTFFAFVANFISLHFHPPTWEGLCLYCLTRCHSKFSHWLLELSPLLKRIKKTKMKKVRTRCELTILQHTFGGLAKEHMPSVLFIDSHSLFRPVHTYCTLAPLSIICQFN